jgi:hypothetical protein
MAMVKKNFANPDILAYHASPLCKGGAPGTNEVYDRAQISLAVIELPFHQRRTLQLIATSLNISKSTIYRIYKKEKIIRMSTNNIKPTLTDQNKLTCAMYCFDKIRFVKDNNNIKLDLTHFDVHLDEKWFFISQKQMKVYLSDGEQGPERHVRNKQQLTKVMFLTALARPRFDANGTCIFDGKIGMWPFVSQIPARRTSVNRAKGT